MDFIGREKALGEDREDLLPDHSGGSDDGDSKGHVRLLEERREKPLLAPAA
ncbi:hypothetical protein GCM10007148_23540 [Parvularcula lutaonensis]|nr:hypothetical protein GCM10007148_23540 [Parvularcula lutaonensis]